MAAKVGWHPRSERGPCSVPSGPTDCLVAKGGVRGDDLKGFAKDLMKKNPAHRPSLIDCQWLAERLDTTLCDDGDMDDVDEESRNKESKAQAKNHVGMNQLSSILLMETTEGSMIGQKKICNTRVSSSRHFVTDSSIFVRFRESS